MDYNLAGLKKVLERFNEETEQELTLVKPYSKRKYRLVYPDGKAFANMGISVYTAKELCLMLWFYLDAKYDIELYNVGGKQVTLMYKIDTKNHKVVSYTPGETTNSEKRYKHFNHNKVVVTIPLHEAKAINDCIATWFTGEVYARLSREHYRDYCHYLKLNKPAIGTTKLGSLTIVVV